MAATLAATVVCVPAAQSPQPVSFLGFRPGAPRSAAEQAVRDLGGRWSCRQSAVDPRFTECLGRITPPGEPPLELTASLVHDSVAILLLSGTVTEGDLRRWRTGLETRIGPGTSRQAQGQSVWQWIRARQMLRLTVRNAAKPLTASVSLVDGALLDGLEGTRAK